MIEYYESATHLNISFNKHIGTRGWQAAAHMMRKVRGHFPKHWKTVIMSRKEHLDGNRNVSKIIIKTTLLTKKPLNTHLYLWFMLKILKGYFKDTEEYLKHIIRVEKQKRVKNLASHEAPSGVESH